MASMIKEHKTRKKQQAREKKPRLNLPKKETSPFGELININNIANPEASIRLLLTKPPIHKVQAGLNPLVDAAAYIFTCMGQLALTRSYQDLAQLHVKLVEEIQEFQDSLHELHYTSEYLAEYIPIATYALCTTLDDIIVHTPWGGQGQWDQYCLLHTYQQETLSRENFLIILERFVQDQAIFIDMMELIYICLNLGFKYSCHPSGFSPEQLQKIMHSLYKRIRIYRGNFSKTLSPHSIKIAQNTYFKPKWTEKITQNLKRKHRSKINQVSQLSSLYPVLSEQMEHSENRFNHVTRFLKNRAITVKGNKIQLNNLPWLLVIGSSGAGKSALMENAKVNFIVNKKSHTQDNMQRYSLDNWDWWVTSNAVIIEVPGSFTSIHYEENPLINQPWNNLLDMIAEERGENGVNSVNLVLSFSEIMDKSSHPALITQITHRISDLYSRFGQVPLNLIISKCDLMPGFLEFFDDYTGDELTQPWGMRLSAPIGSQAWTDIFNEKFDLLIKQLNNQLIYRLHQEKEYRYKEKFRIKDFPLQVERLKESLGDIIKGILNENIPLILQGFFLTSSIQNPLKEQESQLPQVISADELLQSLTIMEVPPAPTQSYFTKHLLLGGLISEQKTDLLSKQVTKNNWLDLLYKQIRGNKYGS